jgi:hypothetical protein
VAEVAQKGGARHEMFGEGDAISLRDEDSAVRLGAQMGLHLGLERVDLLYRSSDLGGVKATFEQEEPVVAKLPCLILAKPMKRQLRILPTE